MRCVFILGAGASAPFGVPTLKHLFQDPSARAYLAENPGFNEILHDIFWNPRALDVDTSHCGLNLEEILTVIGDYERNTFRNTPELGIGNIQEFKKNLYCLSKRAVFDNKSSVNGFINPLITYSQEKFEHVTWASFNWDCLFEASFYYYTRTNPSLVIQLEGWHYNDSNHLFLKLHGGVNWWNQNDQLYYLTFGRDGILDQRWSEYSRGCTDGHPVLLEPSFYKYEDTKVFDHLYAQWDRFVEELLKSDVVIVIGYSLPEADPQARRALTIAFQANRNCKFIVFDMAEQIRARYQRVFGAGRLRCVQESYQDLGEDIGVRIDEQIEAMVE